MVKFDNKGDMKFPANVVCYDCGHKWEAKAEYENCPECGKEDIHHMSAWLFTILNGGTVQCTSECSYTVCMKHSTNDFPRYRENSEPIDYARKGCHLHDGKFLDDMPQPEKPDFISDETWGFMILSSKLNSLMRATHVSLEQTIEESELTREQLGDIFLVTNRLMGSKISKVDPDVATELIALLLGE
ncbi:MAG: hypothetical protein KAS32_01720 [Candidatus Peribacteraceae bacterium]|nr:hypothetical protein [Candidatus Peribacteraceae bacterium]